MRDNFSETKRLVQMALRELPRDNCFSEARFHLHSTLTLLEGIKKKRERRETALNKQEIKKEMLSVDPSLSLAALDAAITGEKARLEEMLKKKPTEKGDNDDFSTFFG